MNVKTRLGENLRASLRANLRIVGAIAAKDIVDAIKNKITLSIMLGTGVMMLTSLALPLLLGSRSLPTAVVYDPGKSTLVKGLTARGEFQLRLVDSQEELDAFLCSYPADALGLVIPPEFRQAAGSGETVEIQGYWAHWIDRNKVASLAKFFEAELGKASWQTVRINIGGHLVYPSFDSNALSLTTTLMLTVILVMGLVLVPLLLVEEKETRTFEALLVSPARLSQVVTGKALAGMFFCLCAAVVALAFNARLFVHWDIAILAVLLGAAFAVAIGLFVGALFDNPATINLWMGVITIFLLVPPILEGLNSSRLPEAIRAIIPWIPSAAMNKLLGFSMAGDIHSAPIGLNVVILVVATLVFYALVGWRVRQMDR